MAKTKKSVIRFENTEVTTVRKVFYKDQFVGIVRRKNVGGKTLYQATKLVHPRENPVLAEEPLAKLFDKESKAANRLVVHFIVYSREPRIPAVVEPPAPTQVF